MDAYRLQSWINDFITVVCELSTNMQEVIRSGRGQLIVPADIELLLLKHGITHQYEKGRFFMFLDGPCCFIVDVEVGNYAEMRIIEKQ